MREACGTLGIDKKCIENDTDNRRTEMEEMGTWRPLAGPTFTRIDRQRIIKDLRSLRSRITCSWGDYYIQEEAEHNVKLQTYRARRSRRMDFEVGTDITFLTCECKKIVKIGLSFPLKCVYCNKENIVFPTKTVRRTLGMQKWSFVTFNSHRIDIWKIIWTRGRSKNLSSGSTP
jgi:hypothetical protein